MPGKLALAGRDRNIGAREALAAIDDSSVPFAAKALRALIARAWIKKLKLSYWYI